MKYSGTGVAVVTPFLLDNSVDFDSLTTIINHIITGGADYIVSLGTTGESATLSIAEQQQVVAHTLAVANGRVPVMVGCGGNHTQAVIAKMKEMETWGNFDCFLSVSPYYNKPSQEGIYQHYKAIATASKKDILLYNVPGRTSRNIEPETTLRLANDFDNIVGVKEASNSIMQGAILANKKPENFTLVSGDDDLILAQMAHGFDGVITVVGNAYPEEWSSLITLAKNNQFAEARAIYNQMIPFVSMIFEENNPAGIKCVMSEMQLCQNNFRLPVCPVNADLDARLREFVQQNS